MCLFLKCNWPTTLLVPGKHYIDLMFLYLQNDLHDKCSNHMSRYNDITKLMTIFPTLYISYLSLICFITESLYLLILLTCVPPPPASLTPGNHLFVLCIKKQRHYFVNNGPSSQGYGFTSSHVWMWDLDYEESWALKNWCFWIVCWRRLLRVPWMARRSHQSILKEISTGCSLERLMLKLKLQ